LDEIEVGLFGARDNSCKKHVLQFVTQVDRKAEAYNGNYSQRYLLPSGNIAERVKKICPDREEVTTSILRTIDTEVCSFVRALEFSNDGTLEDIVEMPIWWDIHALPCLIHCLLVLYMGQKVREPVLEVEGYVWKNWNVYGVL